MRVKLPGTCHDRSSKDVFIQICPSSCTFPYVPLNNQPHFTSIYIHDPHILARHKSLCVCVCMINLELVRIIYIFIFKFQTSIRRPVYKYIMCSLSRNDLQRIFEKLDKKGDGYVSLENLKRLLENMGLMSFGAEEVETLVGKKTLSLDEFFIFYESISSNSGCGGGEIGEEEGELAKAFEVFDVDGDGFISSHEVESVLKRLGLWDPKSCRHCASMIGVYDTNSDGLLDFQEFKNMMLLTIP